MTQEAALVLNDVSAGPDLVRLCLIFTHSVIQIILLFNLSRCTETQLSYVYVGGLVVHVKL